MKINIRRYLELACGHPHDSWVGWEYDDKETAYNLKFHQEYLLFNQAVCTECHGLVDITGVIIRKMNEI